MAQATGGHIPVHEPAEERVETQREPAGPQTTFLEEWTRSRPGFSPKSIWISAAVAASALLAGALFYSGAFSRPTLDVTEGDVASSWAPRFALPVSVSWIGLAPADAARATEEQPKASEMPKAETAAAATVAPPEAADTNPTRAPEAAPRILGMKQGGVALPVNPEPGAPEQAGSASTATPREPDVPAWVQKTWGK